MPAFAKKTTATIIPCLGYRNAAAAIEWLCSVFGFEKQVVYPNSDGTWQTESTRKDDGK